MKTINGERYYVSIGYRNTEDGVDISKLKHLIMKSKEGTVYLDESDKDNVITIPIVPVNEIRKDGNEFIFRFLFYPYKTKWVDKENKGILKFNTIGLFALRRENDIEYIRLISFFKTNMPYTYTQHSHEPAIVLSIKAEENKIIGG